MIVELPSHVGLFVTLWSVACQVALSMGFPRQEYWSGLPFSSLGDHPDPRLEVIKPASPTSLLDYRQILYCWGTREAIRMAKIWNTDNTKCWRRCETTGTLIHCWLGVQNGAATLEDIWQILTKLNILLLYNPAIVLISYLLKWAEKLTSTQKSTCVCL